MSAARDMRERFVATATELLDQDPWVALVLADISADLFGAAALRHPRRVINVGIREQLMVGVAGGLALTGMRPIAHSYAPFLIERPFEQVKLDLGHQGAAAVLVSVGASYDSPENGRTHQCPGDVALLDTLDGWHVHVPGHAAEAEALLRTAVAGAECHYLRLSVRANARPQLVPPEGLEVVRQGEQGTVIAVGPMLDPALSAVADMDVTVLYAATVRPFDARPLLATLRTPDVVLVEPYLAGTSVAVVSRALAHRPHRILGLGVSPTELRRYGRPEEHDAAHGLDAAGLRARISDFLAPTR